MRTFGVTLVNNTGWQVVDDKREVIYVMIQARTRKAAIRKAERTFFGRFVVVHVTTF